MNKTFLLFAALTLATPQIAIAKTVYLLVGRDAQGGEGWLVPMESMDQCEEAGLKLMASKRFNGIPPGMIRGTRGVTFECVEGK